MPIRPPYPSFSLVVYCAFLEPWEAEALMQLAQATLASGDSASVTTQALNSHMSEEIVPNNESLVPTPSKMIDNGAPVAQGTIQGSSQTSKSSLEHHDNVVDSANIPHTMKPRIGLRQKLKDIWASLKTLCGQSLPLKLKKRHHVNIQA